jgi:type I restriction enzyme R subunit
VAEVDRLAEQVSWTVDLTTVYASLLLAVLADAGRSVRYLAGRAVWQASTTYRGGEAKRIAELMRRYTNGQLTSAEVIAELIQMAKEVAAEGNRGAHFTPPLSNDELAFYDAAATNESAVELQGEDVLAQIARELVGVMQRDTKTDWIVRDDVRAKLRSSIKRLLVKYKYPPDKQPEAIKLVIEQMEAMAPRCAEATRRS